MAANSMLRIWSRFWMRFSGLHGPGRICTRIASLGWPPFYGRQELRQYGPRGYVSPTATIHHRALHMGKNVFIDDSVLIFQAREGGAVDLGDGVLIYRNTIIQNGFGGSVSMGAGSFLQPRCQVSAYMAPVTIGVNAQIGPGCAFYPYAHGMEKNLSMRRQPLTTRGGITIEEDAWLGFGVIVLDGVTIGTGAVIGAGSVVTRDIPPYAVAVGSPAKVVKIRA